VAAITVRATDSHGLFVEDSFNFTVTSTNHAPAAADDAASTSIDTPVTIAVLANDSDVDGDGLLPVPLTAPAHGAIVVNPNHTITYTPAAGFNGTDSFTYRATDGSLDSNIAIVTIQVAGERPLQVDSFVQTSTGFVIRFNRTFDLNVLNLYGTELGGFGSPDVDVTGLASGSVRGSLVLDADSKGITFIRTGSVLSADTYTVTLRSAVNGFKDATGGLLDGDHNGIAGANYVKSFSVVPSSAAIVSVPDIARGPGQPVNTPTTGSGIPVSLSDGAGVEAVDITLTWDPTLLTITSVVFSPTLPAGVLTEVNLTVPGVVRVVIAGALNPGAQTLFSLVATVPTTASYRAKHILHFTQVELNELPGKADDGIHVVSYLGDATGNGSYSALDATRILRVSAGLDSGFAPYTGSTRDRRHHREWIVQCPGCHPHVAGDCGSGSY
jgi:hypothetical protein